MFGANNTKLTAKASFTSDGRHIYHFALLFGGIKPPSSDPTLKNLTGGADSDD